MISIISSNYNTSKIVISSGFFSELHIQFSLLYLANFVTFATCYSYLGIQNSLPMTYAVGDTGNKYRLAMWITLTFSTISMNYIYYHNQVILLPHFSNEAVVPNTIHFPGMQRTIPASTLSKQHLQMANSN